MPTTDGNTPRPSRDSIVRAYDAASASRARNARLRSQDSVRENVSRPPRKPLTSQESHDQAKLSQEAYERARASRDVRQPAARRGGNREIIDGRGSIDSRAFNERNELVGYTIDASDQHEPTVDMLEGKGKWRSRSGRDIADAQNGGRGRFGFRGPDLGNLSDTISGRSDFQGNRGAAVPLSIKLLGALVVVLLIILAVLLFL